jgi:hypothetical protein
MRSSKLLLTAVMATAFLAGCAGTNFKRPDAQAFQLGKSTTADISRVMGAPGQTGEMMKNNEKVKSSRYAYAEGAGTGRYPGVTPARAMVFTTFNDVLVGQEFVSSFPEDATEFDDAKVPGIVKGKTTRAEVIALLGKPNGEAIYPLIKSKDQNAMVYSYTHVKGSVFNMKLYSKSAVISLDAANVVTDVEFASTGEK